MFEVGSWKIWKEKQTLKLVLLGVFAVAVILIWHAALTSERGVLTVAFLDVGQGDAIYIKSPNGNQMLIDGGPNAAVLRELGNVMPFYDRTIDLVEATHPDKDHIGGIPDVLAHYKVPLILRSGAENDTGAFEALDQLVHNGAVKEIIAKRGMIIDFGDGVYAEILYPDRDVSHISDTNDASIVTRVVYRDTEFLFTGDLPSALENHLVALDGEGLHSDVLKAGHHGSKNSSSVLFLQTVKPQYGVVSAGADNSYGHPSKEALGRFAQLGIPILSTIEKGTIIFKSDGERVSVE